jgi:uncharacterized Rmd1/YagE family protein
MLHWLPTSSTFYTGGSVHFTTHDDYIISFKNTFTTEVLHARAKYAVDESEPREMFFFREGSLVMWNVQEMEAVQVLTLLRTYEQQSYPEHLVAAETETLAYCYEKGRSVA